MTMRMRGRLTESLAWGYSQSYVGRRRLGTLSANVE